MIPATTLHDVRAALFDALEAALPDDVVFGWDRPSSPADTDGPGGTRRSVWLRGEVNATTEKTSTHGWAEQYVQEIMVQCLPRTASDTVPELDVAAAELLNVVVDVIASNSRPVAVEGWSTVLDLGGFQFVSGRIEGPAGQSQDGYAAAYIVHAHVEAIRCS